MLESPKNIKSLNLIRYGQNLRKKDCGNFWDDFNNLCGNAEALSELLEIPKEKISKWPGVVNKLRDQVKELDLSKSKTKNKVLKNGEIMKSIREWMAENVDMDDAQKRALALQFKGGVKVNPRVKSILKPAMEKVIRELGDENPMDVLRDILAVTTALIGDVHGMRITPKNIQDMANEIEGAE